MAVTAWLSACRRSSSAGTSLSAILNCSALSKARAAIVALAFDKAEQFRMALREVPADEDLRQALSHAVTAIYPDEPDRAWIARMRLLRKEPALAAEIYKSDAAVQQVLSEEIAAR